jgi:hypothetical protein
MTKLYLYLIMQDCNEEYDTYDSAIVVAESSLETRKIHLGGKLGEGEIRSWASFKNVTTVRVGTASPRLKKGVLVASFNAG